MSRCLQIAFLAGALLFVVPLFAQLHAGGFSLSASGTLATSYNGDYGNLTSSDHSIGVGGTGTVAGYYFNPNFLTFNATPYYNTGEGQLRLIAPSPTPAAWTVGHDFQWQLVFRIGQLFQSV